ncbi:MAG: hypothetical protein H7270_11325 [Dermatophilaceae bacterium]|nr:hypothetical protein [Dermatophilaceae bacterium]
MSHRRASTALFALAAGLAMMVGTAVAGPSIAGAATTEPAVALATSPRATQPLTNLAHLNWLGAKVTPPVQARHTTYELAEQPSINVLWTYADPNPDPNADEPYKHVGGGKYDAATNTYGQGAYNADDISRAAVVYLRHWKLTGSITSRTAAYGMLRGLTYLQTVTGPNAGNVVLWMQPDGTLHPSADPVEQPDPSDSAASYWLARTAWALGEGYSAFKGVDPAFAGFLQTRMNLTVSALQRQVLVKYRTYQVVDGKSSPAWLVADGADASAEAVLGLSAYVQAGGTPASRTALAQLSEGIAGLASGDARTWPFGAVLPWSLSGSIWHGWGSQMPAALARASAVLGDQSLGKVALTDSAVFDPRMLTSGGADQALLPTQINQSQIAYGVDSRMQSELATAELGHNAGLRQLAGITAAWYFGANNSTKPAYDRATGRTVDGIEADGRVNRNAGAESTIHGLLSMLALDANPDVAAIARTAVITERIGTTTVQAEGAQLAGSAAVVTPSSTWTGESQFGGTGYVGLGDGGSATLSVPAGSSRLVLPVFDLQPGSTAVTTFRAGTQVLGVVRSGDTGAQGVSSTPGALLPVTLQATLPARATSITATTKASGGDVARLDALMIEPLVSRYVLNGDGDGHGTAVLRSASRAHESTSVVVPGTGTARVYAYDGSARLVSQGSSNASTVPVTVRAGGFTVVRR